MSCTRDGEFVTEGYPRTLDAVMHQVLETGEPILDLHFVGQQPTDPGPDHVWSCSYYRLQDADGRVLGVCEDAFDISGRYQAQRRLNLLVEAGARIGTTLDMSRTAREITEVVVPDFAAMATVDLVRAVLQGGEPDIGRRHPAGPGAGRHPSPPSTPRTARRPARTASSTRRDRRSTAACPPAAWCCEEGTMVVPLRAGGTLLGLVTFVRGAHPSGFDKRGDRARRRAGHPYGRVPGQRPPLHPGAHRRAHPPAQLLPQHLPDQSAVDLAYRYLPSDDRAGVGGDWFDVIALSGTRVGLVVGDVVGHGLQAAATMGRLRTTVRALARLDLSPDELLSRLDDLVGQTAEEQAGRGRHGRRHRTMWPPA